MPLIDVDSMPTRTKAGVEALSGRLDNAPGVVRCGAYLGDDQGTEVIPRPRGPEKPDAQD